jgi:hypothetical protein
MYEFGVNPAKLTAGKPKLLTEDLRSGPPDGRRAGPPNKE